MGRVFNTEIAVSESIPLIVKLSFTIFVYKILLVIMVVSNMSKEVIFILVILSIAIWIKVSQEAMKPSKEINWRKMITLLSAGTLSTLVITIKLFQNLP